MKAYLSWFASAALLLALPASCSLINAPDEVRPGSGGAGGDGGGSISASGTGGASSSSSGSGGAKPCTSDIDCTAMNTDCATYGCQMGTCTATNAADGTPCDDGQFCTSGESCLAGGCQQGLEPTCTSATACEMSSCDEATDMCTVTQMKFCAGGDGCCPAGCTLNNDNDCLYWASGILQNVAPQTLSGWAQCFGGLYNGSTPLPEVLANCTKSKLLLACRPVGAPSFTLVAMAPRADALFDCGADSACVHPGNGVGWYYDEESSWGFAPAGEAVTRTTCDINSGPLRMCWHTMGNAVSSGYRCGDNTLNDSAAWERLVFHAD